jgi:Tol biopolymer transport system component
MLALGEGSYGYPDVSPDGRAIAFARVDREAERIYVSSLSGSGARLLTESPGTVPRWSPDGSTIAFAANRGYYGGIFLVNADGTNQRRLTASGGWPVWWPDGEKIAYVVIGRTGDQEIQTVPTTGGPSRPVGGITFTGSNHPFDISPDGRLLATSNAVHVSDEIWMLEPAKK